MRRFLRLVTPLLLLFPVGASAQVYTRPDSASLERGAAFAEMTYWVETTHGVSEQSVMLKNNSTRAIQITSYEVYDCVNIPSRVCKVHQPGPVIQPGKTMRLVTVSQRRKEGAWSFSYRFEAAYVPQPAPAHTVRQ